MGLGFEIFDDFVSAVCHPLLVCNVVAISQSNKGTSAPAFCMLALLRHTLSSCMTTLQPYVCQGHAVQAAHTLTSPVAVPDAFMQCWYAVVLCFPPSTNRCTDSVQVPTSVSQGQLPLVK